MSRQTTQEEIATLESCQTYAEYRNACDSIKNTRGGEYPSDWWEKTQQPGGIAEKVLGKMGLGSKIELDKFVPTQPPGTKAGDEEFLDWQAAGSRKPRVKFNE